MANKDSRVPDSVPGKWYVDDTCTACGVCEGTAPDNFKMNDDGSHAIVFAQPSNDEQEAACNDAKDSCPAESIGNDGE